MRGRNTLARLGFEACTNPDYMKQGNRYFHYNRLKGAWHCKDIDKKEKALEEISTELNLTIQDVTLWCHKNNINPILLKDSPLMKSKLADTGEN